MTIRWLAILGAASSATIFAVSVAGSCAVPGFDLVDAAAAGPGGGGGTGTAGSGATGGSGACDNAEPPLAPTVTDPGTDVDFVAAVRTLDFGEDLEPAVGPEVGYDLDARSVHWEPGEPPTEAMWRDLGTTLAEHPARLMLWEGEPLAETAERLAEAGVESRIYTVCATTPSEGDYVDAVTANAAVLEALVAQKD